MAEVRLIEWKHRLALLLERGAGMEVVFVTSSASVDSYIAGRKRAFSVTKRMSSREVCLLLC